VHLHQALSNNAYKVPDKHHVTMNNRNKEIIGMHLWNYSQKWRMPRVLVVWNYSQKFTWQETCTHT
jgi:hypothetical protein